MTHSYLERGSDTWLFAFLPSIMHAMQYIVHVYLTKWPPSVRQVCEQYALAWQRRTIAIDPVSHLLTPSLHPRFTGGSRAEFSQLGSHMPPHSEASSTVSKDYM